MKCPKCKSRTEHCIAEDGAIIRYCSSPECDWEEMPQAKDNENKFHSAEKEIHRSS